jgi:hypothetical protein
MLEEVIDLSTGAGVALMPVLLLAVPGIVLFVLLPAILLLAITVPLALIGALLAAPFLLARRLRRRRRQRLTAAPVPKPRSSERRQSPSVAPWRA